jgi:hypothetical protein
MLAQDMPATVLVTTLVSVSEILANLPALDRAAGSAKLAVVKLAPLVPLPLFGFHLKPPSLAGHHSRTEAL